MTDFGGMFDQLRFAFQRQALENEQSAARFAETVASLCESNTCDPSSLARALRGLSHPNDSLDAFTPFQMSRDEHVVANPGDTDPRQNGCGMLQQWDEPNVRQPSDAEARRTRGRVIDDGTLGDMGKHDVKALSNEFKIDKCKFITESGHIHKPVSEFSRILGPRYQAFIEAFRPAEGEEHVSPGHEILIRFIESTPFKIASVLVITLNYFFIIAQTDRKMSNLNTEDPPLFRGIDLAFTGYYTFEVGVSICALRSEFFFFGSDCSWNWFDFIIVFFSLLQELLAILNIQVVDASFLRIMRFMRISKILRMFEAMRMFKEVKIMVDSLSGSFMVFVWCVLIMGLYLSVFAIFFVQGLTTKLENQDANNPLAAPLLRVINRDFGSVYEAMVALFMALTGGLDWIAVYSTIQEIGPIYTSLFLFFFLFAIMSFFNVVTGVFCEKAMSLASPGPHEILLDKQNKELQDATELVAMLKRVLHVEQIPNITAAMLDEFLSHFEVIAFFETRGVTPGSAHRFFQVLLDISEAGFVDLVTFVSGCVKLDGPASRMDMHVLSVEIKAMQLGLHNLHGQLLAEVVDCFEKLHNKMNRVERQGSQVHGSSQGPLHLPDP